MGRNVGNCPNDSEQSIEDLHVTDNILLKLKLRFTEGSVYLWPGATVTKCLKFTAHPDLHGISHLLFNRHDRAVQRPLVSIMHLGLGRTSTVSIAQLGPTCSKSTPRAPARGLKTATLSNAI
jgi:hypothetical protein